MEPCAPACVTSLLFVPVSSSVRPGWCTDSAGLWRISQVKTCELLEDRVERDTYQVCCRCGEASRAGVPSRACEMPGARARGRERRGGRGEGPVRGGHPADVQRAVPGVGACGRPGGNTVERRGGPGESPCPPGRLVLFWGSRGGGAWTESWLRRPALLPAIPAIPTWHALCHCPCPAGLEESGDPASWWEGIRLWQEAECRSGEPHPGTRWLPSPPPHPPGTV